MTKDSGSVFIYQKLYPEPMVEDIYIKTKKDPTLDKNNEDNSQNNS